jgi:hypothetical protein
MQGLPSSRPRYSLTTLIHLFSVTYQDYSNGSTPFGDIAHPPPPAYNRPTLVGELSIRFRVETREAMPTHCKVR